MRILLIKPKHIGDSLILTPTVTAIKQAYPDAEIWVIVRRGCEGILAGCPEIAHVLTLAGVDRGERSGGDFWRQVKTLLRLWSVQFDYVFELGDGHRARLFAMLSRATRRYSVKTGSRLKGWARRSFTAMASFDWQACHRVEKDFYSVSEFLPLAEPVPPLRFDRSLTKPWIPGDALTDFCVVQIGTRQGFNRWRREAWREVCAAMLERVPNVVLSCGPAEIEREEAAWLQNEFGPQVLSTEGQATWAQVAWLLYRAKLYVGPSTATLHLAAACGCPAVAIFGPTIEDHWHPWRSPYRIVTTRHYIPTADSTERFERMRKRTMDEIEVRDVIAACDDLLRETSPVV